MWGKWFPKTKQTREEHSVMERRRLERWCSWQTGRTNSHMDESLPASITDDDMASCFVSGDLLLTLKSGLHIVYQGLVSQKYLCVFLRRCLLHPPSLVKTLMAVVKIPCSSLWSHKRCISTFFTYTVVSLPCKQTCKWCVRLVDFPFQGNIKRTGNTDNAEKVLGLGQEKVTTITYDLCFQRRNSNGTERNM